MIACYLLFFATFAPWNERYSPSSLNPPLVYNYIHSQSKTYLPPSFSPTRNFLDKSGLSWWIYGPITRWSSLWGHFVPSMTWQRNWRFSKYGNFSAPAGKFPFGVRRRNLWRKDTGVPGGTVPVRYGEARGIFSFEKRMSPQPPKEKRL